MRTRRPVPPSVIALLWPFFRYSVRREAYVLRVVGRRFGPALVPRRPEGPRLVGR